MKRLATITFAIVVAATATACSARSSGPAVANVGSSPSSSPTPTSTSSGSPVAFARCMRSHGLKDFPDPGSNGHVEVTNNPGNPGMNANSPQFKSAYAACKSLMPPLSTSHFHPDRAQMLKYAQCMRSHGLSDFPDPDPQGGLMLNSGGDLNPRSPLFQRAQNACKQFQPGGGDGSGSGIQPGGH